MANEFKDLKINDVTSPTANPRKAPVFTQAMIEEALQNKHSDSDNHEDDKNDW